jgi:radical SAM-linked protein
LQREAEFSEQGKLTPKCSEDCKSPCGVCNKAAIHITSKTAEDMQENIQSSQKQSNVVQNNIQNTSKTPEYISKITQNQNVPILWRCIFSFSKANGGEFIPHLSMQELFRKAFLRSGIPVVYTSGFNPIPRLEFACNLLLGIQSYDEIASCIIETDFDADTFTRLMNASLPQGFQINRSCIFPITNKRKRESLASALWGSEYNVQFLSGDLSAFTIQIPFEFDRPFRDLLSADFDAPYYEVVKLIKKKTIAKSFNEKISYFDLYKQIAEINRQLM